MRLIVSPAFAVLLIWMISVPAHSAESLDEYIASFHNELRAIEHGSSNGGLPIGTPPSLDLERLLQHSRSIIHSATATQKQQLFAAFIGVAQHHAVPAGASPIPNSEDYLAFTEVQVIFSEILDRSALVQRASWATGDSQMPDALIRSSCTAPSIIDFQRRVLEGEIDASRYAAEDAPRARALSARLAQRSDWYVSAANLSTCKNLSQIRVAPWTAR